MKRTSAACLCHLNPHKSCCVTSHTAESLDTGGHMGSPMFPYTVPDAPELPWIQFFFSFKNYFPQYLQSTTQCSSFGCISFPLFSSATSTLWLTPGLTVNPSDSLEHFWVIFLLSRQPVLAWGGQTEEWHIASWILSTNAGTSAGKQ